MTNAMELYDPKLARTVDGRPIRLSKEELSLALAPIFAMFPNLEEMPDAQFNAYYLMLCDLNPDRLAVAVIRACQAHKYPTQLVTVAAIREAYDSNRQAPGPRTDVDPTTLPDIPYHMHRLPDDEDKRQRLARLRATKGWGYA